MLRITIACCVVLSSALAWGEDWPQWRGPDRSDVSPEKGLLPDWPADGPKRVWLNDKVGLGYSGMAVVGGTLYTMAARDKAEFLIALNVSDGSEKWSSEIGPVFSEGHGDGPRCTPTIDGDHVYALSGMGDLVCATTNNGDVQWKVAMKELGGSVPHWGYTESVLVDGDKVICTPGGANGTIAALDKKTGKIVWQSKDLTEGAQYTSMVAADHNGKRQYIQLTMSVLAGVDAADGKVLWRTDWPGRIGVIPTPIYHAGQVYVSSGYGTGCKLVTLNAGNEVTTVYENKIMKNHHGGVVLYDKHLYGYSDGVGWVCQEFGSGKQIWSEKNKLGKGCLTFADGRLYLLDESTGAVVLIEASPEGWKEHGRFTLQPQAKQRKQGKVWTHPTVANGRLYLRDQELLFSFDVRE